MANVTEEEAKRYRAEFQTLVDAAAPKYNGPVPPQGTMAVAFAAWQNTQIDDIGKRALSADDLAALTKEQRDMLAGENRKPNILNNADQPIFDAIINARQEKYKKQYVDTYMQGIMSGTGAAATTESAGAVTQAAGLLGIGGDGIGGFILNMVSKLGPVGEFVLSGMKVIGSMFGSLLGSLGIGEPGARMMGFGEARQQVRDTQARTNGANALVGLLGNNIAGVQAELQNATAPAGEIKRVPDNANPAPNTVLNTGMDKAQALTYLRELKAVDNAGNRTPSVAGIQMAELIEKSSDAFPAGTTFMAVLMPDNTLGVAVGKLSADTTTFIPSQILEVKNNVLVTTAPPANMKPLETGLKPPPPTPQQSINGAALVEQTLADNLPELRARIAAIRSGEGALALPPEALVKLNASLNQLPADDKRFTNMDSILVVLPDKTPAILSGRLNADTGQFQPLMVTMATEDGKPPISRMISDLKMVTVTPTLDGTRLVASTKTEDKAETLATSLSGQPATKKLGEALAKALKDPAHPLNQIESDQKDKVRSTAVILPGGKPVIITSLVSDLKDPGDKKGPLIPIYMSELSATGDLQLPKRIAGSPPLDAASGRTIVASKDADLTGLVTPDIAKNGVAKALKELGGSDSLSGLPNRDAIDQVRQMLPAFLRGGAHR